MTNGRVAIIILNWNGRDDTLACLESLQQLRYRAHELIVVDNGSSDGSVEAIRQRFPAATVLETGANLGFTGGNNVGIRHALASGSDYLLLLNNDTEADPALLDDMVSALEADPTLGAAGPTIYYHSRPQTIWSAGGVIDWRRGTSHMRGLDELDQGQYAAPSVVDFVTGCALLVRSAVVEQIGLLDDRFFMYYEETEWCVRITRRGYRIVHVPTARLWHKIDPEQQAATARIAYYMARNRLLFLRLTRASPATWLHAALLQDLRTCLSLSLRPKWRGRRQQRDALLRAWRDFWAGRFGRLPA